MNVIDTNMQLVSNLVTFCLKLKPRFKLSLKNTFLMFGYYVWEEKYNVKNTIHHSNSFTEIIRLNRFCGILYYFW